MADIGSRRRKSDPTSRRRSAIPAASGHGLLIWCKDCRHEVKLDQAAITAQAERYGADLILMDWKARLRCSACGSRAVDLVVTSTGRMGLTAE